MTGRTGSIRIAFALAGALALLAGLRAGPVRAGQAHPTWVAFGDSLTALTPQWTWTRMLARRTGNTVINAGTYGATTGYAVHALERDVLRHHPDLVLVMFGVNDQRIANKAGPDGYAVPPDQYRRNLEEIVTRIQATGARVVLMTNRPLIEGPGAPRMSLYLDRNGDHGRLYTLPGRTKGSIRLYNEIVRDVARRHGTGLVDIWRAVVDQAGGESDAALLKAGLEPPGPALDGVHFGPAGARLVADAILAAMPFPAPAASAPRDAP